MISYEQYKAKVYDIFEEKCLNDVSKQEKIKYLKENEELINNAYKDDVYSYENLDMHNVFTDINIYSRICTNLEELY